MNLVIVEMSPRLFAIMDITTGQYIAYTTTREAAKESAKEFERCLATPTAILTQGRR